MEHIPMTPNNMNLAIRVLQKVLKLKFFFMTADLYSWIIDFSMRKCMHPKKQKNLQLKFFFMSADLYSWIIDFTKPLDWPWKTTPDRP